MTIYGIHSIKEEKYVVVDSILIAIAVIIGIAFIANVYTWSQIVYSIAVPPRKRVQRIGERQAHHLFLSIKIISLHFYFELFH